MKHYPVYLNLEGRRVLLIGAGRVALQKIPRLLDAKARVHVVSPKALPEIQRMSRDGKIQWSPRPYRSSDLRSVQLVIAATDDVALQKRIAQESRAKNIWVNVVDVPPLCDFIAPAIVQRGDIQMAISTGGAAPALAKYLRKKLDALVDLDYAEFAKTAKRMRPAILKRPKKERKAIWRKLIYG